MAARPINERAAQTSLYLNREGHRELKKLAADQECKPHAILMRWLEIGAASEGFKHPLRAPTQEEYEEARKKPVRATRARRNPASA